MRLVQLIFLVAFFLNSLVSYGLVPSKISVVTEVWIYLLLLYSFLSISRRHETYRFHLLPIFILFLIGSIYSIIINEVFSFQPIFSLRLILRFFFFYIALINLDLNTEDLKRINTLLFVLFIIQIPASGIKFYFYGLAEKTVGTYGTSGDLTPVIPIIGLGYLAGYYFFHKARKVYLILALGFVLYGIVGIKAALFILYPATFLGLYYLISIRERRLDFVKNIATIILVVLLSAGAGAGIISVSKRLNPERIRGGGTIDFSYALERAKEYTTATMSGPYGEYGGGRIATTILAFNTAWKGGFGRFIFGYGPGSITKSAVYKSQSEDNLLLPIRMSYGVTGMTYVLIEYGMFGVLVLCSMFYIFSRMCWKWYNDEKEPYWKAFSFGALILAFLSAFVFFAYNKEPIIGDTLPPVYFYVMAVMYLRTKATSQTNAIQSTA